MEKMSEFVAFRTTRDQAQKLDQLVQSTGTNRGWVLRSLVAQAELVTPAVFASTTKSAEQQAQRKQGAS